MKPQRGWRFRRRSHLAGQNDHGVFAIVRQFDDARFRQDHIVALVFLDVRRRLTLHASNPCDEQSVNAVGTAFGSLDFAPRSARRSPFGGALLARRVAPLFGGRRGDECGRREGEGSPGSGLLSRRREHVVLRQILAGFRLLAAVDVVMEEKEGARRSRSMLLDGPDAGER